MDVTKFIEDAEVRKFFLSRFPKPVIEPPSLSLLHSNVNPSLTGKVIEFLIRAQRCGNRGKLHKEFEVEVSAVQDLVDYLRNGIGVRTCRGKYIEIILERPAFGSVTSILRTFFKVNTQVYYKSGPFTFIRIEKAGSVDVFEICRLTGVVVTDGTVIVDWRTFERFLLSVSQKFFQAARQIVSTKVLTPSNVKTFMDFAQLSSPYSRWPGVHLVCKRDKKMINYAFKLMSQFLSSKPELPRNLASHPILTDYGIRARPDFISKNILIEIKTTKRFFSNRDYLQALLYLILAQSPSNRKARGSIDKILIFYPLYGRTVILEKSMLKGLLVSATSFLRKRREALIKLELDRIRVLIDKYKSS